ncbi:MAG: 30S ribosome-binding factor RbfA [Desulfarculus sp.]|nr:30S ribosome-binding factor RbfA [Pseudomonadota bacterium]MBV1717762.1 30S ribosome-binding factor RbfA [Desulfarculus sp.]MBU4575139.1 30S ribosome-binding factor RbfA [Pseudomonadota bacterium]MBU4596760.1 30S ribosome-binding factor RbfA [Pseudomonadota bacterium]MBV1740472.1 30S ribosome-binding factor RbfA [Desulfarculus sp.]
MGTRRTKRLGNLILAELGGLLARRVKDPRVAAVSLTAVDVAPDLSQAKVYFSVLDPSHSDQALAGLRAAAGFLRKELAANLRLKTMPRLVPVYDDSLIKAAHLDQVIRQARAQDEAAAEARGDDDPEEAAS